MATLTPTLALTSTDASSDALSLSVTDSLTIAEPIVNQARKFKAKNIIIKNKLLHNKVKKLLKNTKTKVFSGDISLGKIIKGKKENSSL